MRLTTRLTAVVAAWAAAISVAHLALNVDWAQWWNAKLPRGERKFNVAYIPVT